jgi:hypothetical protein
MKKEVIVPVSELLKDMGLILNDLDVWIGDTVTNSDTL